MTEQALQANPDIDAIVAANDDMAFGAAEAASGAGIEVPIIGFDALPEALQAIEGGTLAVTVEQFPGGQTSGAMEILSTFSATALSRQRHITLIEPALITVDNLGEAERLRRPASPPPGLAPLRRQPTLPQQRKLPGLASSSSAPSPDLTGEGAGGAGQRDPEPRSKPDRNYTPAMRLDPPPSARGGRRTGPGASTPSPLAGTADAGLTQASGEDVAMPAMPDLFDVLDHLGDAVVILDREYRIVAHNAAAYRRANQPPNPPPQLSGTLGRRQPGEPSQGICDERSPTTPLPAH